MDEERKKDFQKLKEVLRLIPKGKFTPQQLGTLMEQYAKKHLNPERHTVTLDDLNAPLIPLDSHGKA